MKKTNKSMRLLSILLTLLMVFSMLPLSVVSAESAQQTPNATVTELAPMTLTAAEHNYMVWPSGDSTIDRPLDVVVNFKANDTLEECLAGDYAYWKTDFYLTFDGLKNDSIIADDCYLAGNYGSFGWVVIPTDGLEIEEGVEYPVVKAYDANITYKQICESVKNFTAAIHVSDEILEANPDFKVTLSLKMTNPEDPTDVLVIDEPIVCTIDDLAPIAENVNTGKTYADLNKALAEAAGKNETVKLMEDVNLGAAMNVTVQAGTVLDLNGKTISGDKLLTFISFGDVIDSTEGEGGVEISKTAAYTILSTTNTYLPIYDSAAGCYRFFKFEVINKGVKAVANDSDRIKYGYVLKFSSKTAYELLANDAANAGLELKAKLTVDKGDGNASVFDYTCTSGVLSTYANTVLNNYDIFTANYNTVITFAVSGIERLTDGSTVSTVPTLSAPATTVAKSGDSATFTK